ncbi:MAG: hypothetical protein KGL55_08165 [Rhodospirillales bacterium]|nr:hypothetical protein [Rhodospirillales bacterium]
MSALIKKLRRKINQDTNGVAAVEYVLLFFIIGSVVMSGGHFLGIAMADAFSSVSTAMTTTPASHTATGPGSPSPDSTSPTPSTESTPPRDN